MDCVVDVADSRACGPEHPSLPEGVPLTVAQFSTGEFEKDVFEGTSMYPQILGQDVGRGTPCGDRGKEFRARRAGCGERVVMTAAGRGGGNRGARGQGLGKSAGLQGRVGEETDLT